MRGACSSFSSDQLEKGEEKNALSVFILCTRPAGERVCISNHLKTPDQLVRRSDSSRTEEACVPAFKLLRYCGPVANATDTAGDSDALGGLFGAASTVCELPRTAAHGRHGEDAAGGRVH